MTSVLVKLSSDIKCYCATKRFSRMQKQYDSRQCVCYVLGSSHLFDQNFEKMCFLTSGDNVTRGKHHMHSRVETKKNTGPQILNAQM